MAGLAFGNTTVTRRVTMIFRFLLTGLALFPALIALESSASEAQPVIQFVDDSELPGDELETFLKKRPIGDYRVVRVDSDGLRRMLRDAFPPDSDSESLEISLALVDGTQVRVLLEAGGEHHSGWRTGLASFLGRVAGDEFSTVRCVISPDGSVNLVIRTAGKRYKLEKTAILPYHVYWSWSSGFSRRID